MISAFANGLTGKSYKFQVVLYHMLPFYADVADLILEDTLSLNTSDIPTPVGSLYPLL